MKEIFEAIDTRIKNPIFGYFIAALVALNWQAFFYLFADNGSAESRIFYFDNNTDLYSILIFPFLFSGTYSVAYAWINYLLIRICKWPTELKNELQADSEHNFLVKQKELEELRAEMLSSAESELIERAKRDVELNKIEDEKIKNKLKDELNQLRTERDELEKNSKNNIKTKPPNTRNTHKSGTDNAKINSFIEIASTYRKNANNATTVDDRDNLISQALKLEEKAHSLQMKMSEPTSLISAASTYRNRASNAHSAGERDDLLLLAQELESKAHDLLISSK